MSKSIMYFLLCWRCTSLIFSITPTTKASKTANIYVINMKERKDRCLCMASQLNNSPFPVFKITAATVDTQFELCPAIKGLDRRGNVGTRNRGGQSALFCSNYLAWLHAAAPSSKADFTVVLEDDVIFDQAQFWPELQNFLDSDCEDHVWDQILVDTIHMKKPGKQYLCTNQMEQKRTITSGLGYGTHMQIFRTSSLHKYLSQMTLHTTDKWSAAPGNTTLRGWNPNLVLQSSQLKKLGIVEKLPSFCGRSTMHSDIESFARVPTTPKLAFEC